MSNEENDCIPYKSIHGKHLQMMCCVTAWKKLFLDMLLCKMLWNENDKILFKITIEFTSEEMTTNVKCKKIKINSTSKKPSKSLRDWQWAILQNYDRRKFSLLRHNISMFVTITSYASLVSNRCTHWQTTPETHWSFIHQTFTKNISWKCETPRARHLNQEAQKRDHDSKMRKKSETGCNNVKFI